MKLTAAILCMTLMLTMYSASKDYGGGTQPIDPALSNPAGTAPKTEDPEPEKEALEAGGAPKMNIQIGTHSFTATLEDNAAVHEWMDVLRDGPVTIQMSDYSGFEKVGPLGTDLTASNSQTTTTAGDIVLYNGNSIVLFYGSNSWSYTRIGKVDDLTDWAGALGHGDITATFSLEE